jgi:hypothetical protein
MVHPDDSSRKVGAAKLKTPKVFARVHITSISTLRKMHSPALRQRNVDRWALWLEAHIPETALELSKSDQLHALEISMCEAFRRQIEHGSDGLYRRCIARVNRNRQAPFEVGAFTNKEVMTMLRHDVRCGSEAHGISTVKQAIAAVDLWTL